MTTAIELRGVDKRFGSTVALDRLDVQVASGEIHGYLGPNGAGKSVTMRILLGLLRQDAGSVEVLGRDPWRDAVDLHHHLAYVPGDVSLWPNLSGGEIIDYFARLRGDVDVARRDALIERFELDPRKKAGTYSKGNRQKVALVTALASKVELLLLDEPTAGLDPLMETVFQDVIEEVTADGRTVFLSSHILAEVEKLCDRVTIIRNGTTVRSGSLDELRTATRTSITVATRDALDGLDALSGVHGVHREGGHTHFEVDTVALDDVMSYVVDRGVVSLVSQPPTLEELFLREYGDDVVTPAVDDVEDEASA